MGKNLCIVCYILTQLMRTGAILMLLALPLNALFGWNVRTVIIITGLMVMLYSMLGGIKAVIWTDAIQGIILIAGALVCAIILTFSMPEGPGQLFEIARINHKFSLGSFGTSLTGFDILGGAGLWSLHQPSELRHRSELCPAIYDDRKQTGRQNRLPFSAHCCIYLYR